MSITFNSVAIIGRQNNTDTRVTLSKVIAHLQSKKIHAILEQDTAKILSDYQIPAIPKEDLAKHCQLIIVVGGDGSMLSAARIAARQNLPVIGINRGNLGFLTDIAPDQIAKIDEILAGNYYAESRFLLATATKDHNNTTKRNLALNDVLFLSYIAGHMLNFSVYVNDKFVCDYSADGLIISTPTGSTAHALSGGGPILTPDLEAITLVPMFSHNLSSRPIVVASSSIIKVVFNSTDATELLVRCDGQVQTMLHGSYIKITKAPETLCLLHPISYDYFETLRTKLHWETR